MLKYCHIIKQSSQKIADTEELYICVCVYACVYVVSLSVAGNTELMVVIVGQLHSVWEMQSMYRIFWGTQLHFLKHIKMALQNISAQQKS